MLRSGDEGELIQARMHHVQWGQSGPRVVLLHAIGFDHSTWERVAVRLSGHCRMAAVDLPGHGDSDKPLAADYGLASLGARVLRFLDEIGWEDALLVGNSLGGGAAIAAALQAPDRVRGLALLNTVGFRSGLPVVGRLAFIPLVPLVTGYTPSVVVRMGLESARHSWGSVSRERAVRSRTYLRSPEGQAAFFRALRQLYGPNLDQMAERYGEIRCPTLVLHGEKDPLIGLGHAERLAGAIPRAELVRLPRCGHFPQEERPGAVAKALEEFIRRTAG